MYVLINSCKNYFKRRFIFSFTHKCTSKDSETQQNYWIWSLSVSLFLNSSKSLLFEKEILICQEEEEKYGTQIRMLNRMIFHREFKRK